MARAPNDRVAVITVHGFSPSGNCHKVRLLLEQTGRDYRWVEVDSSRGETRRPGYLEKNPNAKVPMIELDDGSVLVESNAILWFLSEGTVFAPDGAWGRAQALSWMFFEQYSHEPAIAVSRFIRGWTPLDSPRRDELAELQRKGLEALAVMEWHLASRPWFSGERYGIADMALFAYTEVAGEGGFDLTPFPRIGDWLGRVARTPDFVPMPPPAEDVAARLAASADAVGDAAPAKCG